MSDATSVNRTCAPSSPRIERGELTSDVSKDTPEQQISPIGQGSSDWSEKRKSLVAPVQVQDVSEGSNVIVRSVSPATQVTRYNSLASRMHQPLHWARGGETSQKPWSPAAALARRFFSDSPFSVWAVEDFQILLSSPHTRHIMLGIAACLTRDEGHFMVVGARHFKSLQELDSSTRGFFNGANSIVMRNDTGPEAGALLVHEGAHLLIKNLTRSDDPSLLIATHHGISTSEEAALLDAAIAKDRAHRAELPEDLGSKGNDARAYLQSIESPLYFHNAVSSHLTDDEREILRIETIVRIPQFYALQVPRATIQLIAPNVLDYYEARFVPALGHAVEGILQDSNINAESVESITMQHIPEHDILLARAQDCFEKNFVDQASLQQTEELDAFYMSRVMNAVRIYGVDDVRFDAFKKDFREWLREKHGYVYRSQE